MRRLMTVLLLGACLAGAQDPTEKRQKNRQTASSAMTGCVDQRNDEFILVECGDMTMRAVLRGQGFSDDNFARFVGLRVKVEGRMDRKGDVPLIHVTRIDQADADERQ